MNRLALIFPICFIASTCMAQIEVDRPIILEDTLPTNTRVEGLPDAVGDGDALNARTAMLANHRAAIVGGSASVWTVDPTPAFTDTLLPGAELVVKTTLANSGPVTILVNGIGPFDLLHNGTQPMDSGMVLPGMMLRLLFDGIAFHWTAPRQTSTHACPPGTVAVNGEFCIEPTMRDTLHFREAAVICGDLNGRMCSWAEWYQACVAATQLGLSDMVGQWEWTNNTANGDMSVRVVGQSTCTHAHTSLMVGYIPRNYRCCFRH